jgi:predicted membrane protein
MKEKRLETMLVITVGMLVLFLIFKHRAFLFAATAFGLVGVFSGFLSEKITWAWHKIALFLGHFNATVLLSLVFFVFLTPIAFLYRMTKKDTLRLQKPQDSAYETRNHTYVPQDLEDTW